MTLLNQEERLSKWAALIEEQEKSSLTQKQFCQDRGLIVSQLVYYRGVLKRKTKLEENNSSLFSSIQVKKEQAIAGEIKILLPNGFQCIFPNSLDPSQGKRWVEALLLC